MLFDSVVMGSTKIFVQRFIFSELTFLWLKHDVARNFRPQLENLLTIWNFRFLFNIAEEEKLIMKSISIKKKNFRIVLEVGEKRE